MHNLPHMKHINNSKVVLKLFRSHCILRNNCDSNLKHPTVGGKFVLRKLLGTGLGFSDLVYVSVTVVTLLCFSDSCLLSVFVLNQISLAILGSCFLFSYIIIYCAHNIIFLARVPSNVGLEC